MPRLGMFDVAVRHVRAPDLQALQQAVLQMRPDAADEWAANGLAGRLGGVWAVGREMRTTR